MLVRPTAILLLAAALPLACAGTASQQDARSASAAPNAGGNASQEESLPPYFSVAITDDGAILADGAPVADLDALAVLASSVAASGKVEGAAVLTSGATPSSRRNEVVRVLVDAGFVHVRIGPIPAPAAATRSSSESPARPSAAQAAPSGDEATAPAERADPEPVSDVGVETIGLHVGGSSNDDEERSSFLSVLEMAFDDLRACFPKAAPTQRTRSFGVDLYIPSSGKEPKVRDVRTSLRGEEFERCAVAAFERLTFAPPPRGPTVVSYSVRFDPVPGS